MNKKIYIIIPLIILFLGGGYLIYNYSRTSVDYKEAEEQLLNGLEQPIENVAFNFESKGKKNYVIAKDKGEDELLIYLVEEADLTSRLFKPDSVKNGYVYSNSFSISKSSRNGVIKFNDKIIYIFEKGKTLEGKERDNLSYQFGINNGNFETEIFICID